MQTEILLDMDGVLTNFVKGMCDAHHLPDPYCRQACLGNFDMASAWGIGDEEFWTKADYSFWSGLEPTPECHELCDRLESRFGRDNICILSKPNSSSFGCMDAKAAWLKQHVPRLADSFLFGTKKKFCAAAHRVLIDDYDLNVDAFVAAGGNSVLLPRPWNRDHHMTFGGNCVKHVMAGLDNCLEFSRIK